MFRVLITGGAGFIGSNLCEELLKLDNQVICMDNFITGKKDNIEPFIGNKNFKLIEGVKKPDFLSFLKGEGVTKYGK